MGKRSATAVSLGFAVTISGCVGVEPTDGSSLHHEIAPSTWAAAGASDARESTGGAESTFARSLSTGGSTQLASTTGGASTSTSTGGATSKGGASTTGGLGGATTSVASVDCDAINHVGPGPLCWSHPIPGDPTRCSVRLNLGGSAYYTSEQAAACQEIGDAVCSSSPPTSRDLLCLDACAKCATSRTTAGGMEACANATNAASNAGGCD